MDVEELEEDVSLIGEGFKIVTLSNILTCLLWSILCEESEWWEEFFRIEGGDEKSAIEGEGDEEDVGTDESFWIDDEAEEGAERELVIEIGIGEGLEEVGFEWEDSLEYNKLLYLSWIDSINFAFSSLSFSLSLCWFIELDLDLWIKVIFSFFCSFSFFSSSMILSFSLVEELIAIPVELKEGEGEGEWNGEGLLEEITGKGGEDEIEEEIEADEDIIIGLFK